VGPCTVCSTVCPAGQGMTSPCSMDADLQCAPCPPNTWQDGTGAVCRPCSTSNCPAGQGMPGYGVDSSFGSCCSATANAICGTCKPGYFQDGTNNVCVPCSTSCPAGTGMTGALVSYPWAPTRTAAAFSNNDFEGSVSGACPTGWTCTGDAHAATASTSCGGYAAGNVQGTLYASVGCDSTTGTMRSPTFTLPAFATNVSFLRAGGANGPASGLFVKLASDNSVLCSANTVLSGTDTDVFFSDSCTGLAPYVGLSVYIYVVDAASGNYGKTYVDNIRVSQNCGGVSPCSDAHACVSTGNGVCSTCTNPGTQTGSGTVCA